MSEVRNNVARSRFELETQAGTAFAAYIREGDLWTFTHTIVPEEAEGRGVGSRLVHAALEVVQAAGGRIVPQCRFVAAYLQRHPEWQALAAD